MFLFFLALGTLVAVVGIGVEITVGNRSIGWLGDVGAMEGVGGPGVSIVIAARDERRKVEEAMRSVVGQEYGECEVIAVDDRSTDGTGEILDRLARAEGRLRVVHVTELPEGWLGKCHALEVGAGAARGELLLFADADVVMEPTALGRAVGYMTARGIDHLAVVPEVRMPGAVLRMFTGAFALLFAMYAKPWKAKDPRSRKFIGIGAFNLVRAAAYRAAGTHRAIAMRPDDDIKLGKLIKRCGFRQDALFGKGVMRVEWYSSLRELIDGLMKNAFAGVEYSVGAVAASTLALTALYVWPFCAIFLTTGPTRLLNLAAALAALLLYAANARLAAVPRWYALGFPLAILLFVYILWRSALLTLWQGGITWRGTHYPLAELRANKI